MIKPEQPTNLIGVSVVNFTGTPGIVTSIGIGSDRPFILWKGNSKPISADWENIELAASIDIQEILNKEGLTAYGAAQVIGDKTKEAIKTIHARLSRWKKKDPLEVMRRDLGILGYEIKVEKIKGKS